jgi:hypothetical protein
VRTTISGALVFIAMIAMAAVGTGSSSAAASHHGRCNHWSGQATDGAHVGDRRALVNAYIYRHPHLRVRDTVKFKAGRARVCALYVTVAPYHDTAHYWRIRLKISPRGGRSSSVAIPRNAYIGTMLWFRIG